MHTHILQPYKGPASRHRCPQCNKPRRFTLYIDTQTGQPVHPTVGRCDREISCAYHFTPKQYYELTKDHRPRTTDHSKYTAPVLPVVCRPWSVVQNPSYIRPQLLTASLTGYQHNHFITYLVKLFGQQLVNQLIFKYRIGSSKHWQGATVFWQIDTSNHIRTGKIMLYNAETGKRIKQPFNHINWVHTVLKLPQFNLQQCLFGAHLLTNNTKPIGIVESEKTAIIATACMPQYTWLATGGLSNLNTTTCACLKNVPVTLFPDLNAIDKWKAKAQQLNHITQFHISTMLEEVATDADRQNGLDLGDYLVRVR